MSPAARRRGGPTSAATAAAAAPLAPVAGRHWAEARVERWLERRGWRAVARNVSDRHGEIDLVMRDGEVIVFVEVRQRRGDVWGGAAHSIDSRKAGRVRRTAAAWLAARGWHEAPVRFDAVLVSGDEARARVRLVCDAF